MSRTTTDRRTFTQLLAMSLAATAAPSVPLWAQAKKRAIVIGHTGITWPARAPRSGGPGAPPAAAAAGAAPLAAEPTTAGPAARLAPAPLVCRSTTSSSDAAGTGRRSATLIAGPAADVPNISSRRKRTAISSSSPAIAATAIAARTSIRLLVRTPPTSSPIATRTTERTAPNRNTSRPH